MRRGYKLFYVYIANTTLNSAHGFFSPIRSSFQSLSKRTMTTESTEAEKDQSWRSLLEVSIAKSRKIRGSNYVQIATVEEGEPRCRTVVFRGFLKLEKEHNLANICDDKSCIMKMCTHLQSKKVAQNAVQPIAEMVWWFPKTSEQYRIRGPLLLVGKDAEDRTLEIARKELWGNLSDPARESFLGKLVPGESFEEEGASVPAGGKDENGKMLPPPDNFLLMLLDPKDVDYLRLTGDQFRQIDCKGPLGWSMERVNP